MLVKNIMLPKEKLITVSPKSTIGHALEVMNENKFLSIPVAEGEKFYGTISKDRIYEFYYEKCEDKQCFLSDFNVEVVMREDIPTILPMEQMEKAVHFLEIMNISFVAVIDNKGAFEGILTHHAVFEQFTSLFGLNKGQRLAVMAYDIPGQISKLSKILSENNADIISFVVVDPKSVIDVMEIVVRMRTDNFELIEEKVKEAGFKIV
ncbi:CBS domain-containing protein [Clostridium sp. MSJ-4]|uniref:CBS domain-containing protein n=1 Tax=Clostridium simiarum TaxID=2841506 RepID=A0ABS6EVW0_9CLOT|nr:MULTISPECIES: CBS domain-containing protein [Clostridium]MBU5590346.1 CBS domain-containing protein [Clostridium simiarum]